MKFKLDPNAPAWLIAKPRRRLEVVAAMPGVDTDYSDIPRQSDNVQWTRPGMLAQRDT